MYCIQPNVGYDILISEQFNQQTTVIEKILKQKFWDKITTNPTPSPTRTSSVAYTLIWFFHPYISNPCTLQNPS